VRVIQAGHPAFRRAIQLTQNIGHCDPPLPRRTAVLSNPSTVAVDVRPEAVTGVSFLPGWAAQCWAAQ
jgi:hypothetical protein